MTIAAPALPINAVVRLRLAGHWKQPEGRVARPTRAEQDTGLDRYGPELALCVLVEWSPTNRTWEYAALLDRVR